MKWFRLTLLLAMNAALFWALNFPHGSLPPPGRLLNPFSGFWRNGTQTDNLPQQLALPGLRDSVAAVWDRRHVPHIFAGNLSDLYYAQGYLCARERLWQMDFQSRAAAGRLSEIVGTNTLEYDRFRRRIGMVWAAERMVEAIADTSEGYRYLQAYTDGVNAYIEQLDASRYPIEFKLLNYQPEPWTPVKSALILKLMAWDLTGRNYELPMTLTRRVLGDREMDRLYPFQPPFPEPVIPVGTRWEFSPLQSQSAANSAISESLWGGTSNRAESLMWVGSNNWAVSPQKTASGKAILCSDPHLVLNLPSIWYENQLAAPGMNVYGVSIPGLPGVVVGFNRRLAWGMTNTGSDVLDWFQVRFKDSSRSAYLYQSGWKETVRRAEVIRIKGAPSVIDTVLYTHYGPVPYVSGEKPFSRYIPLNAAMRWKAHDPSNEFEALFRVNRARNYSDFVAGLNAYDDPAQNFAYADADGNIAMWHNGKFPLRKTGAGRYISDGSGGQDELRVWIPHSHLPHVLNPEQGFLASANQHPADSTYPYYLGWNYAPTDRAHRINELLGQARRITLRDMRLMQVDDFNWFASKLLPELLGRLAVGHFSEIERTALEELKGWDFHQRADAIAPTIFERWWREVNRAIWKDENDRVQGNFHYPARDVTLNLILTDPGNLHFDLPETPYRETIGDLIQQTFGDALHALQEERGEPGEGWQWGKARGTDIYHLAHIAAFSRLHLPTSGNYGLINATTRIGGPSWRMIVELGDKPTALGIYPGGQSGHPGSEFYDIAVDDWLAGKYYPLMFLSSAREEHPQRIATTVMKRSTR